MSAIPPPPALKDPLHDVQMQKDLSVVFLLSLLGRFKVISWETYNVTYHRYVLSKSSWCKRYL